MSKADRRKGNAQCASSGKAAELLLASGRSIPFIGSELLQLRTNEQAPLHQSSSFPDVVGELITAENVESPQIRAVFKRLSKRDALTKEKALKELKELLKPTSEDEALSADIKPSFSHFTSIYPVLVTDASPAVRAGSNTVLSFFLQTLKKGASGAGLRHSLPFLFLSLHDPAAQVVESATALLNEYFVAEKRGLVERNFSEATVELAIEMVNRKHKLVLPQKFTSDEETDEQRRCRLICQALRVLERMVADKGGLEESDKVKLYCSIRQTLSSTQVLNTLVGMNAGVKASTFALIARLAQSDSAPFLDSKLPSVLLNHLDAPEPLLCKNAFECFLLLAQHPEFFGHVKVDKAVVPKFLSMLRRKGRHWSVLETALLPSFSLIAANLTSSEAKEKWISTSLSAFFEGETSAISVQAFVNAFLEVHKYCLLNFSENPCLAQLLCDQLLHFVEVLLEWPPVPELHKKASLKLVSNHVAWMRKRRGSLKPEATERIDACMAKLRDNLLAAKLSNALPLIDALLEHDDPDPQLCSMLIQSTQFPNRTFLKALRGLRKSKDAVEQAVPLPESTEIEVLISQRLHVPRCPLDEMAELINCLGPIVEERQKFSTPLHLEDGTLCLQIMKVNPGLLRIPLLSQEELDSGRGIVMRWLLQWNPPSAQRPEENEEIFFTKWVVATNSEEKAIEELLKVASEWNEKGETYNIPCLARLMHGLSRGVKKLAGTVDHLQAASTLFRCLLNLIFCEGGPMIHSEERLIIAAFDKLELSDSTSYLMPLLDSILSQTFASADRIKRLAALLSEFPAMSQLFTDDFEELCRCAEKADELIQLQMLEDEVDDSGATERLLLPFSIWPPRSPPAAVLAQLEPPSGYDFLLLKALRRCIFNNAQHGKTNSLFGWFLQSLVKGGWATKLFSYEAQEQAEHLVANLPLNVPNVEELGELLVTIMSAGQPAIGESGAPSTERLPLSVIWALQQTFKERQLIDARALVSYLEQRAAGQGAPPEARTGSLLVASLLVKFVLLAEEFSEEDCVVLVTNLPERCRTLLPDPTRVLHWLVETLKASSLFTSQNRAQHIVTLDLLIDELRAKPSPLEGMEEWLFTLHPQSPQQVNGGEASLMKDALSCSLLHLCAKCVPHLLEAGDTIKDFINCGFITALQSCTDHLFIPAGKARLTPLALLQARTCLQLYTSYDSSMRLNKDRREFRGLRQEWLEFFGPSATNFIMGWFLSLKQVRGRGGWSKFEAQLCTTIHSMDAQMMLQAEPSTGGEEEETATPPWEYSGCFSDYPPQLRKIVERAAMLLASERSLLQVQLAAARVVKNALLNMFLVENAKEGVVVGRVEAEAENTGEGTSTHVIDTVREEEEGCDDEPSERKLPCFLAQHFLQLPVEIPHDSEEGSLPAMLLCWWSLVSFLVELDSVTRVRYCEALTPQMVGNVLVQLLALLPSLQGRNEDEANLLFEEPINFQRLDSYGGGLRNKVLCHLYYRTCTTVPTLVRQWYNSLAPGAAATVNGYTKKFLSPLIIRRELSTIENQKRGHLEVRVQRAAREVEASYKFEGHLIQLAIQLPPDFPLVVAKISKGAKAMLDEKMNRRWLLQLEMYLNHQNGSILDGILRWKRNIDQHLAGKDECVICMAVISASNSQLPRRACRSCRKKFHSKCLEDWFKKGASEAPRCPLCRAAFF